MAAITDVKDVWSTLTEVDLAPLRDEALIGVTVALVGASGSGRGALSALMRRDPNHPQVVTQTPVMVLELSEVQKSAGADLVILMVDAQQGDFSSERQIADQLIDSGQLVLVVINQQPILDGEPDQGAWSGWDQRQIAYGNVDESDTLMQSFVPAVIRLLPGHHLALARSFPLFRVAVANHLIGDTCLSNSAYTLSTGLAEMVPLLLIPLNVADIIVLTKMQAFLIYKLGLALGLSTRWQDYVAEFGGVLGGGFLWRQAARSLVGLIPGYGIIPKVAIAYAGTYVVGHVVLRWYLTGMHLSRDEVKLLYQEALGKGKEIAKRLVERRPGYRKRKSRKRLPGAS